MGGGEDPRGVRERVSCAPGGGVRALHPCRHFDRQLSEGGRGLQAAAQRSVGQRRAQVRRFSCNFLFFFTFLAKSLPSSPPPIITHYYIHSLEHYANCWIMTTEYYVRIKIIEDYFSSVSSSCSLGDSIDFEIFFAGSLGEDWKIKNEKNSIRIFRPRQIYRTLVRLIFLQMEKFQVRQIRIEIISS